ncbi:MAG TPA: hypothetical protein VKD69_00160 [Vicinamibacterales bacterium]|nr:hypothetical protein [Vicinamibacterales bacterium]
MRPITAAGVDSAAADDPYRITTVCTVAPVNTGRRVPVSNGAELQRALDAASAGDTILLATGVTFTPPANDGSFVLRNRPLARGQWIVVRSANGALDAGGQLAPHTRAGEEHAAMLAQIRTATVNAPAIRAESGASGYRLIGLDIGIAASVRQVTNLVELGVGAEPSIDAQPTDIIVDRSYLHGNDEGNFRRGVLMNGVRIAVIDSSVTNFHDADGDSQAVGGSLGAGPFKIVNNLLEAASENIIFGGADPTLPDLVPHDIEVRRNLMTKRLTWQAARVPVKNAFELKNASRVIVEGNTFEHVWVSGQDGGAIVLKSVDQDGRCPWCVTEYVTFRNNVVRGAANGLLINAAETGARGLALPRKAHHIRIENVVFDDIGGRQWGGGGGKLLRVYGGVSDVSITHITSRGNAAGILDPSAPTDSNPGLVFKNNIVERMYYGIGTGSDEGTKTLSRNFNPYTYGYNVLVNTSAPTDQAVSNSALESRYPARTWVVSGWDEVGFQPGSSALGGSSRFSKAGDDRKDVGADVNAITTAQQPGRDADGCAVGIAVPK